MLASIIGCIALALPFLLLAVAWTQKSREKITYVLLTISAFLLLAAFAHPVKVMLLGPDYDDRLYFSIGLNILTAIAIAIYLAITRRWIAALAALILAFDWFVVAGINSTV